jgi:glycosyltransferase involved in cell wall biosynthesis
MKPEVSVIIPSHNRLFTLSRAIDSVLIQQGITFELILVDDGSTDDTRNFVTGKYPQASYYYQENKGPSAARNLGIEKARGNWLAFLDSDDEWLPGKLQAQLEFFRLNPDYRIVQTQETWIRDGKRVNPMKKHEKSGGLIFNKCLPLCVVSPSAVMIHRSLLEEVGLFDESLPACEDYDLWLRIAAKNPIGFIEKSFLIRYGGHADQTSAKYPVMDNFRIQTLIKILKSGELSLDQAEAARLMLKEKSKIVIQGALKREKFQEAQELDARVQEVLRS